ncbi:hypothetical protein EV681_1242 [Advenella incenata]|uniref:Uncharacterized protein n=1 Tax=Advenella incenata TaxID=267800 RepID=A0A4Q7VSD3_9BURK|nr:hypothetical protein EV681_1242 [Advenella incenata]
MGNPNWLVLQFSQEKVPCRSCGMGMVEKSGSDAGIPTHRIEDK